MTGTMWIFPPPDGPPGPPPTFVGRTGQNGTFPTPDGDPNYAYGSLSVHIPSEGIAGDLLVICMATNPAVAAPTPTGWNLVQPYAVDVMESNSPGLMDFAFYWKRMVTSEPEPVFVVAAQMEAWCLAFRGCLATGNPVDVCVAPTGTSVPITTNRGNDLVMQFCGGAGIETSPGANDGYAEISGTLPVGFQSAYSLNSTNDSNCGTAFATYYSIKASPGTVTHAFSVSAASPGGAGSVVMAIKAANA